MNEQEIREIFSDEAYVASLLALDTAEEVQASLAEKGIDLSTTEIHKLLDSLQKHAQSDEADGELSEDALETVTGGLVNLILFAIISLVFLGTGVGAAASSASGRRW